MPKAETYGEIFSTEFHLSDNSILGQLEENYAPEIVSY